MKRCHNNRRTKGEREAHQHITNNTVRATNTDARISCTTRRAPSTWVSVVTLRIRGESDARPNERPRLAVCRDMVQRVNNQPTWDKTAAGIPDAMFMTRYQCPFAYYDRAVSRPPRLVETVQMHSITCTSSWPAKRDPSSHM